MIHNFFCENETLIEESYEQLFLNSSEGGTCVCVGGGGNPLFLCY